MTRTVISCFLLLSVSNALWPVPKTYHHGESVLWIAQDVLVSYSEPYGVGFGNAASYIRHLANFNQQSSSFKLENVASVSGNSTPSIMVVQVAMEQIYRSLFFESFVPWKFHPRGASFEPTTQEERTYIHTIALKQLSPDTGNHLPSGNRPTDESYTLDVLLNGQVIVNAASSVGIAHALATLSQLFYTHSSGGSYMTNAPVHIQDHPTFAHRGLNLDVARNYYPAQDIKRTIDALAFNKMNRLHLHITDAQSWPLEIPSIPELAAHGAYHPGLTYSPQALEDLQRYGLLRGVETFIEIDMPGHTSSIWFSHPELIAAFNVQPNWMDYAGEPPSGTLKLNSSEVYDFLDRLFADLVPRVSPWTSYFHTGGDEVDFNTLLLDETVRSNEPDVLRPLLQKFFDHTRQNVHSRGMTQIVWEELLLEYNLTLPKDVVVQAWRSESSVASIVNKGHHVIAGNYEDWVSHKRKAGIYDSLQLTRCSISTAVTVHGSTTPLVSCRSPSIRTRTTVTHTRIGA